MYSGYGGYGMYNYGNYNNYENYYDPDKSIKMWGLSVGWGKRLKWPDDYFTLSAELAYQRYNLKDWQYFPVTNGKCNDLSILLTTRSSRAPVRISHYQYSSLRRIQLSMARIIKVTTLTLKQVVSPKTI